MTKQAKEWLLGQEKFLRNQSLKLRLKSLKLINQLPLALSKIANYKFKKFGASIDQLQYCHSRLKTLPELSLIKQQKLEQQKEKLMEMTNKLLLNKMFA